MVISPFTLHVRGDGGAKEYLKYACDTLHFTKVTFHRVSRGNEQCMRSYLRFLSHEACRSLFFIRHRRIFFNQSQEKWQISINSLKDRLLRNFSELKGDLFKEFIMKIRSKLSTLQERDELRVKVSR